MAQIRYSLRFPYGTQEGRDLTNEFELAALSSHFYAQKNFYQEEMSAGYVALFGAIASERRVSFYKAYDPLDFLSVFSSAKADHRTIPYAFLYALRDKDTLSTLVLKDFQVVGFHFVSMPDKDRTPLGVYVQLNADSVAQ